MKKLCTHLMILILTIFAGGEIMAQPIEGRLGELAAEDSRPRYLRFEPMLDMSPQEFFIRFQEDLGLTEQDKMEYVKSVSSSRLEGLEYHTYQQYHKGIAVHGGTMVFRMWQGKIKTVNGDMIKNQNLPSKPLITSEKALDFVIEDVGGIILPEERKDDPEEIVDELELTEIVIITADPLETISQKDLHTCYKFTVIQARDNAIMEVYVDIESGEIVKKLGAAQNDCRTGTVRTPSNGSRSFTTNRTWEPFWTHHRLKIDCRGYDIVTERFDEFRLNRRFEVTDTRSSPYKDGDNIWGTTGNPHEGATVHWGMQQAWDYFDDEFGHRGFDGNGGEVEAFFESDGSGPFYLPATQEVHIQEAAPFTLPMCTGNVTINVNSWAVIDILAHEYTHGVIDVAFTLGGGQGTQAGALNEGFADIFGAMVEREVGATFNEIWTSGQDASANTLLHRSFISPNNAHFRANAAGTCFNPGIADEFNEPGFWDPNGGVHANSGPLSHWFYLLVTGNTHQNGTTVTGIGFNDASLIAWETLMSLPNGAGYVDARDNAIDFAELNFGFCSQEHIGTIEAFNAINLPSALPTQNINPNISGGLTSLCANATTSFSVAPVANATYNWSVTGGLQIVTQNGNSCAVKKIGASTGTLSVVVATNCGSGSDNQTITGSSSSVPSTPNISIPDFPICLGGFHSASVTNPQPGVTYTWSSSPANSIDIFPFTGTNVNINPNSAGSRTVIVTPSNACGSGTPGTRSVYVHTSSTNSGCGGPIFVRQANEDKFKIAPNPTSGKAVLTHEGGSEVQIMSLDGRLVKQISLDPEVSQFKMDLKSLPRGMYLIKVLDEFKYALWTEKVVLY